MHDDTIFFTRNCNLEIILINFFTVYYSGHSEVQKPNVRRPSFSFGDDRPSERTFGERSETFGERSETFGDVQRRSEKLF